jgi:hypothetical protein
VRVKQDRHDDVRSLANEDGSQCRTDRLRERLPTGGEEAKQMAGRGMRMCAGRGETRGRAGAVGDMVGVRPAGRLTRVAHKRAGRLYAPMAI